MKNSTLFSNCSRPRISLLVVGIAAFAFLGGCSAADDTDPTSDSDGVEAEGSLAEQTGSTSEALSGLTCPQSAADDEKICQRIEYFECRQTSSDLGLCYRQSRSRCAPKYTRAVAMCELDVATVFRVSRRGTHNETKVFVTGTVEAQFNFFPRRHAGADPNPIYRCAVVNSVVNGQFLDFPSRDANCEGKGPPISVLGYSLPPGVHGAKAVYRCRTGDDHFLSWHSNCEGQANEELIGYAW